VSGGDWKDPRYWLFPGDNPDQHIGKDAVELACRKAQRFSDIAKPITPHSLRQASAYCTTFQSSFILKTIGLGRARSAGVYGGRAVPLSPVPVLQVGTNRFSR
jgi:hypothetical protein